MFAQIDSRFLRCYHIRGDSETELPWPSELMHDMMRARNVPTETNMRKLAEQRVRRPVVASRAESPRGPAEPSDRVRLELWRGRFDRRHSRLAAVKLKQFQFDIVAGGTHP